MRTNGKTVQKVGKPKLRNWYYGASITGMTRAKIIDFILGNNLEDKTINIATDGLLLSNVPESVLNELKTQKEDVLGGWDVTQYVEGLVIGNGMMQLFSEKDGKRDFYTKLRGITGRRDFDVVHDFQQFGHLPAYYPQPHIRKSGRPMHLRESIIQKDLGKEAINIFKKTKRQLNPSTDKKMKWKPLENIGWLLRNHEVGIPLDYKEILSNKENINNFGEL